MTKESLMRLSNWIIGTALTGLVFAPVAISQISNGQLQARPASVATAFTHPNTVRADLAELDYTLNHTLSFSGRFTQIAADGAVDSGTIHLKRPGKLRIEYEAPNPLLIVSDGVTLVQQDRALETADRVPLASTPLNFFLKENVNLAEDTEVVSLIKTPQEIRVTSRDGSGEMEGDITMVFDAQTLAFKAWVISDSFGGQTRVLLSDLQYNPDLDPRLFVLRDDDRRDRRRR